MVPTLQRSAKFRSLASPLVLLFKEIPCPCLTTCSNMLLIVKRPFDTDHLNPSLISMARNHLGQMRL